MKSPDELDRALRRVRLVISDVDGVMTDGRITLDANGWEIKSFHVRDGLGIKRWRDAGGLFAVVTGRSSAALDARLRELSIGLVERAVEDKAAAGERVVRQAGVTFDRVAVLGDDLVDLPLFDRAAVSVAPADAMAVVRERADLVTTLPGGAGCVREFLDRLLAARQTA